MLCIKHSCRSGGSVAQHLDVQQMLDSRQRGALDIVTLPMRSTVHFLPFQNRLPGSASEYLDQKVSERE